MRIFFSTVMKMWIGPGKFWIDRPGKTVGDPASLMTGECLD